MRIVEEKLLRMRKTYVMTDDVTGEESTHCIQVLYVNGDLSKPIVYSSRMEPIMEATLFMREELKSDALNTRLQAASAIKLAYAYCELFGTSIESLSRQQAKGFVEFLRGTLGDSASYSVRLSSIRSENTVSKYLSAIRRLVVYLGAGESPLLERKAPMRSAFDEVRWKRAEPYSIAVKTINPLTAPKYISQDQYISISAQLAGPERLRDRVITRLLYEHGLRLGEVLGMTLEDIRPYLDDDGLPRYMVELRNRVTDQSFQRAKGAMKVRSHLDYKSPSYHVSGIGAGFECVALGDDLAEDLLSYIEEAHAGDHSESYYARRNSTALADKVTERIPPELDNCYVFLNTLGRPLSDQRWGQILRKAYLEAQVPVDRGTRRLNLSHRLRHGFAMYLKRVRKLDEFQVMILMRHTSLLSGKAYDNPTPEDILRMQEEIIDQR